MLNWYRAAARYPALERPGKQVTVPTTIIWGAKDRFLGAEMAEESAALCDSGELIGMEANTHWVQHEAVAAVNETLIARFSS
jgi:pimeloyl-ACP methyl ester carboxylesterase